MSQPTDLVYLREPQRRTLLATVTGTRGAAVVFDKTIFAPTSRAYRHPQPADRGEVWVGGDKRVLSRVSWERGEVRHVLRGVAPPVGTSVRMHLDGDRRDLTSLAHLAMHAVVSAFARRRLGVITKMAEVVGGGRFNLSARWTAWSPHALKDVLEAANATLTAAHEVSYEYVPRDLARGVDPQPYEDGVTLPGEEATLRLVKIGDASVLPCDGTFPDRTPRSVRVVAPGVRVGRDGVHVQFRVDRA